MARTLGFIADRFLAAGHATTVVSREQISPNLVELVLSCADFATTTITPGDATSWLATRNDFRHYTPAEIDPQTQQLRIIIAVHGSGPGEQLLLSLEPGSPLPMTKFVRKRSFTWQDGAEPIVVVGDSSVISLAMAFRTRIGSSGRPFRAILEVAAADTDAVTALVPGADIVAASDQSGAALYERLTASTFTGAERFYLAGHGQSIQRQRDLLRDAHGFDRKSISTQPFWATGKTGL